MPSFRIFVTATNTDVGKTYATIRLMHIAAEMGLRPLALKPIETGVGAEGPPDGVKLLQAAKALHPDAESLKVEDIVPYSFTLPAAPFVAKGGTAIDPARLTEAADRLGERCDVLFIEGAGGPMVPVEKDLFMIDLPRIFDAHTLLVAPGGLGSINDTLLSLEALENRRLPHSLLLNLRPETSDAFKRLTRPYYDASGIDYRMLDDDRTLRKLLKTLMKAAP